MSFFTLSNGDYINLTHTVVRVPDDDGCGWVHRKTIPGSKRHYLNDQEITKRRALELLVEDGREWAQEHLDKMEDDA